MLNPDDLNELGSLLSGNLTPEERERIVAKWSRDEESLLFLNGLFQPSPDLDSIQLDLPFPIASKIRLGLHENFLRLFDEEGDLLAPGLRRIERSLSRLSSGRLPCCFRGGVEISLRGSLAQGLFRIDIRRDGGGLDFHLTLENEEHQTGYIEFWRNGSLVQATPADTISKRPILAVPPSGTWAVRHSHSPTGIGMRVAETPFFQIDWLGAGLSQVLEGDLLGGARTLGMHSPHVGAGSGLWDRLVERLQAIASLATIEGGRLVPLPATRQSSLSPERRVDSLRFVWVGISHCWPEAATVPNPWSNPSPAIRDGVGGLSAGVEKLLRATVACVEGEEAGDSPPGPVEDQRILEGWAALRGWRKLADGDYASAALDFRSSTPSEGDPFSLIEGGRIASQLAASKAGAGNSADPESASEEILANLIREVLEVGLEDS